MWSSWTMPFEEKGSFSFFKKKIKAVLSCWIIHTWNKLKQHCLSIIQPPLVEKWAVLPINYLSSKIRTSLIYKLSGNSTINETSVHSFSMISSIFGTHYEYKLISELATEFYKLNSHTNSHKNARYSKITPYYCICYEVLTSAADS